MEFQLFTCIAFPGTQSQFFIIWTNSSFERRFELSISGHFNTKAVSNQQFRLTPHTEHQCVPFCDYNQVQAKYRLNMSLHFNLQHTLIYIYIYISIQQDATMRSVYYLFHCKFTHLLYMFRVPFTPIIRSTGNCSRRPLVQIIYHNM
jgi:hypothetical protein